MSAPSLNWGKRTYLPRAVCSDCDWVLNSERATASAKRHASSEKHEVIVEHLSETTYYGGGA